MERQRLDKAGDGRIRAKSDQIVMGSDSNLAPFHLSHPFLAKAQQPSVGNPRNEGATSMAGNSFTWAIYWSLLLLPVYWPPLHQLCGSYPSIYKNILRCILVEDTFRTCRARHSSG